MGSSKKHKDKDREHKHKKRRRSRSRSRSKERSRRHKRDRDRSKHEKRDRDKKRRHSEDRDVEFGSAEVKRERSDPVEVKKERTESPPVPSESSRGGELSLTIEDTNKLRAKLGLKPLEVPGENSALKPGEEEGEIVEDVKPAKEDVHVPAVNLGQVKRSEDIRQKMAQLREKRLMNARLGKVKTLADSDDELESAMSWVKRSRKQDEERKQAEKRAKLLDQMDEEFGLSDLVEEEFGTQKKQEELKYGAHHLAGLKVQHAQDSFKEGKSVILTLQDHNILDDEADDVLVNVNMIDNERAIENVENKKRKPQYQAYDMPDIDEFGVEKPREILSKYTEEIAGKKKEMFMLGSGGGYNTEVERQIKRQKAAVQAQGESLILPPPVIAREFFTQEEMSQKFKKVRKKERKIRKKPKVVKADDLQPIDSGNDHGRRNYPTDIPLEMIDKSGPIPGLDLVEEEDKTEDMEVESLDEVEILGPEEDLSGVPVEEDEAGIELEIALKKARKLKQVKVTNQPQRLAEVVESTHSASTADDLAQQIILNSTSEFCRSLGEIPTYGLAGNREEDDEEIGDMEHEWSESRGDAEGDEEQPMGWMSVEIDTRPVEIKEEEKGILDDEPVVNAGLGGALQLASKKGYLESKTVKRTSAASQKYIEAQNYSIEDKRYDDLDEKYRKRDRYTGGAVVDFREKEGYKPDVKIDYVDDTGRTMTPKEAFRYLSHSFHGKGSGKKKTEKRSKKVEEEMLMKSMSSTDTPLNTVKLLQDKQKAEKSPYVILSGSSKGLTAGSLTKQS